MIAFVESFSRTNTECRGVGKVLVPSLAGPGAEGGGGGLGGAAGLLS